MTLYENLTKTVEQYDAMAAKASEEAKTYTEIAEIYKRCAAIYREHRDSLTPDEAGRILDESLRE